jgi:8-oxo-dGTP pyrophosphatase MutT (NUDIX family)
MSQNTKYKGLFSKKFNLPIVLDFAARAIVFNSKNELLLVSRNGTRWHFPGGSLEEDESSQDLCIREVYEETGLKVEVISPACFGEASAIRETIYNEDYTKLIPYPHIIRSNSIAYHCMIKGKEDLDPNWIDSAGGVVKYRKFVKEDEYKNMTVQMFLKDFQNMTFQHIKNLQSIDIGFITRIKK